MSFRYGDLLSLAIGLSLLCSKYSPLCFLAFPQFSAYYAYFCAFWIHIMLKCICVFLQGMR